MSQDPRQTRENAGSGSDLTKGRWLLVGAALLLQFAIGAVYAWSVFASALQDASEFELSKLQSAIPFEVTIGMIFIGTYTGGRIQDRRGPRIVALAGGVVYAAGTILASFAQSESQFWLLVLGYGVISGFGLGLAYIVPIAMLQKWFPDKRGLITGLAVGGFGFGAVLTSPIAQWLIGRDPDVPTKAFLALGIAYLALSLVGASAFRNPPEGYQVPGFTRTRRTVSPAPARTTRRGGASHAPVVHADGDTGVEHDGRYRADLPSCQQRHRHRGLLRCSGGDSRRGARSVQRRRPDRVGCGLRQDRPDACVRGDAGASGHLLADPASRE